MTYFHLITSKRLHGHRCYCFCKLLASGAGLGILCDIGRLSWRYFVASDCVSEAALCHFLRLASFDIRKSSLNNLHPMSYSTLESAPFDMRDKRVKFMPEISLSCFRP
jgi:hypothetical protein